MHALALAVALVVQADPEPNSGTVKGLIKDVGEAPKVAGIDVSRMPFTPDSIKQVVLAAQPQIQGCYEETLASKGKAVSGNIKTHFVITPDGYVKGALVDKRVSSLKEPRLADCVVAVLSAMVFPKPPDGKDHPIDFPFNLKPVD
jgi:hypothetical protein